MLTHELISYLDDLLQVSEFSDYCPNGLQVAGHAEITKIVTGVSISQELIEHAVDVNANAILVHHGLFWQNDDPRIIGVKKQRLQTLLTNNINLIAYHLPLDFHSVYGNNIIFAQKLGIEVADAIPPFYCGKLSQEYSTEQLAQHIQECLGQQPVCIVAGGHKISTVAWCVGKAPDFIEQVANQNIDAYITGEISEASVYIARESGVHLFAVGHYASERYGVQALGKHLAERYQASVDFIDIPNPI